MWPGCGATLEAEGVLFQVGYDEIWLCGRHAAGEELESGALAPCTHCGKLASMWLGALPFHSACLRGRMEEGDVPVTVMVRRIGAYGRRRDG